MKRLGLFALVLVLAVAPTALAQDSGPAGEDAGFGAFTAEVTPDELLAVRRAGFEPVERGAGAAEGSVRVQLVLSDRGVAALGRLGIPLEREADADALRAQADEAEGVFRPYSGEDGLAAEMRALAAAHPDLVELVEYGRSLRGQPLLALRVTRNVGGVAQGARPATLYLAAQHAREWITPEMVRRLARTMIDGHGSDPTITRLLSRNEYWFVFVANPDGYDHTFTDDRLWRKNLADNDGDGAITSVDGVDLNRNFPTRWGWDDEGSSPDPFSEVYRGPAPGSEPETQAFDALARRIGFAFVVNYHSAAELLLYGVGWQQETPTPDDVVYRTLVGTDAQPAVPGYDPDISAELYVTNGETTNHLHERYGTLAFTPEMATCQTASARYDDDAWEPDACPSVFNFPDDERLIAEEFARNLPFALDVARSTARPDRPVSHLGLRAPHFVIDEFDVSYGVPQPVQADVRRSLGRALVEYRVNGGPRRAVAADEWEGGERYGRGYDVHYRRVRGRITGAGPGDTVTYRFGAGAHRSRWSQFTVASDTGADVLVVAAEDHTGPVPDQASGPTAAPRYLEALAAAGYEADLWDVDAKGRTAPHPLGVLAHYDVVVTETGRDVVPRTVGQAPGTVARWAQQLELALRDFVNDGGGLLYAGSYAGFAAAADGGYVYQPDADAGECPEPDDATCLPLTDDFLQYWLGAWTNLVGAGTADGARLDLVGADEPFTGRRYALAEPAQDEDPTTTAFVTTSSFLPATRYPQFASRDVLDYDREGADAFAPFSGQRYLFSDRADAAYKRIGTVVSVPDDGAASVAFQVSYDVETDWDHWFVEARPVGTDEWTTLPVPGLTTQGTGLSCAAGWTDLHPFLRHYQTPTGQGCDPVGTTGAWHAVTGSSDGWREASVDLSAYAGRDVEVVISSVSDWAFQNLGVFIDDLRVLRGDEVVDETSFEADLGAWELLEAPEGSPPAANTWRRSLEAYEEGAAVATDDTLYFGFGIESVERAQARADLIGTAVRFLLR